MSGIFSSMNTATKGLMAQQTALHTTGHNISNVNTEGFTRQRVDMQADRAFSLAGVGQLGTGVRMQGVVRMIDDHVSKHIRNENSTLNKFGEKSDVIGQLEVIFNEPSDTGLNVNIGELFDAFQKLGNNPENANAKTVVVEKLKTLTDTLNHMARQIDSLEKETHDAIDKNVLDFNSTVDALNVLNKQIFNIAIKGQVPNDLLDQRDMMLKDLSAIAGVEVDLTDQYGRVDIKLDGNDILTKEGAQTYIGYDEADEADASKVREIRLYSNKTDAEGKTNPIKTDDDVEIKVNIEDGKIAGNQEAIKDVDIAMKNLDDLANKLGQSINLVHKSGNPDNINIFTNDKDGIFTAKDIKINEDLKKDNTLLQTGIPDDEGNIKEGDNSLILELAGLRDKKISINPDGTIKTKEIDNKKIIDDSAGNTIGGSYRDIIIKIGVSKQHADNMVDNQGALVGQLEMRRESVSGVSINDEITNVMKFQKAYEANAKVISVLTDMLDVLINRTGV